MKNIDIKITRKAFIKKSLLAAGSAAVLTGGSALAGCSDDSSGSKKNGNGPSENTVYVVKNGSYASNISKLFEMIGGIESIIDKDDVVVIKGNAQWPCQGYTHTGCIKAVIDEIYLAYPDFSGEIFICDNVQAYDANTAFNSTGNNRDRNWADHNWTTLAANYQSDGKKVTTKKWVSTTTTITGPADVSSSGTDGWIRHYFSDFHGVKTYLSYPVFLSSQVSGRVIDMKNGVWENGSYTGRKVKTIFMPTLNNHGNGIDDADYAGVTSAIKSFFGATELHGSVGGSFTFNSVQYLNVHSATYGQSSTTGSTYAGELAAWFINNFYKPVLYITAAMWTGHGSRSWPDATETKTVLACTNPATLDYVACRDVIGPLNPNLNPNNTNNTRRQILGCISGGVGTIEPGQFEVITHNFS